MIKLEGSGTITVDDINEVRRRYPTEDVCIVIENTKYQYPEILEEIARMDSKITFSVLGGLNPKKEKFNSEYYQRRTYYNPMELSKIIKIFQSIERGINLSWNETQKAMYVYQQICNHMVYSENSVNGRDCARGLSGLLYDKAVCAGFAIIFKEAMDRLGIKCVYQNRQHHHSWNIAYLDGAYRALDLTWDVYEKTSAGCGFKYFNQDSNFYKNEHHDLSNEKQEQEYEIVPYTIEELTDNYRIISSPRILRFNILNGRTSDINLVGKKINIINSNGVLRIKGTNYKSFVRNDGKQFVLVYTGSKDKLNKFFYFTESNNQIIGARIYSEVRLDAVGKEYDNLIANGLLSRERINKKVRDFNGYV